MTKLVEVLVWQLGFYMLPGEYNMKGIDNHSPSCLLSPVTAFSQAKKLTGIF